MGYFAKRTASTQQIDVGVSRCAVAGAYKGDSFADDMRTRFFILYDNMCDSNSFISQGIHATKSFQLCALQVRGRNMRQ